MSVCTHKIKLDKFLCENFHKVLNTCTAQLEPNPNNQGSGLHLMLLLHNLLVYIFPTEKLSCLGKDAPTLL